MSVKYRTWLHCLAATTVLIWMVRPVAAQDDFSFFEDEAKVDAAMRQDKVNPAGMHRKARPTISTVTIAKEQMVEVEVVKERYPNRAVKVERHVTLDENRNFVNHGLWTMYAPNGTMLARGDYWKGQRQGKWVRWFIDEPTADVMALDVPTEDAEQEDEPSVNEMLIQAEFEGFSMPIRSEATFVEGTLMGTWSFADADDRPICSYEFDRNQLHGAAIWHYSNGQKRRQITFRNGVVDGEWKQWEPNGTIARIEKYVDGRRMVPYTEYFDSGEKYCQGHHLYAPNTIKINHDWWEGLVNIRISDDSHEKLKHSLWTYWYRNGGKMTEGEFASGKAVGLHVWWFENGQQKAQGEFAAGEQVGDWAWWHENGMKKTEGQIIEGRKVGTWSEWKEDGSLVDEKNHSVPGSMMNAQPAPRHYR